MASAQRDFETRKMDIVYRSKVLFLLRCENGDALVYSRDDSAWGQCVQASRSCKNGVGVCSGLYGTVNFANNDCGYNDNSRITTAFPSPEQSLFQL